MSSAVKTSKSSVKKKTSRKSVRVSNATKQISEAIYNKWENAVLTNLQNTEENNILNTCDKKVCGVYTLLSRVFMVLDFDESSKCEFVKVKEPSEDSFHLYNLHDENQTNRHNLYVRKPLRQLKKKKKRYIASDLRGLTFYIGQTHNHPWFDLSAGDAQELRLQKKMTDGATLSAPQSKKKATVLFKNISKLLGGKPRKTTPTELVQRIGQWINSVYKNLKIGDVVNIRLATLDAKSKTIKRSRVFIPATDVRRVMGDYYTQTGVVNNKRTYKSNTEKECEKKYMAVNVDENGKVVSTSHLSTNEPHTVVDFMADKQ